MTLEQLSSLGEIIGAIAVVASLVALAFQMRQNTKAVYAQAARDAEAVWGTFYFEVGKDKELSLLTEKLLLSKSSDEFSKEEYARTIFLLRSIWSNLQSEHSLALDHSLRPEVWQRRVKWIRGLMQIPIVSEFVEHEISQQNVDPRLVEQIMAQGDRMQMGRLFDRN
jgi:hypothetical protein